jgi:hypothetical protein
MCWRAAIVASPHVEAALPSVLVAPLSQGPLSEAVCIICRNFPRRQGRHTHGHSHPAGGRRVQFDDVKAAR